MRTMLRIAMSTEPANKTLKDGLLPKLVKDTTDLIKPEATYFTADHGVRTAYFFFDMKDSSQMPVIAESWFLATGARIEFMPVMNGEDLKKGLEGAFKK